MSKRSPDAPPPLGWSPPAPPNASSKRDPNAPPAEHHSPWVLVPPAGVFVLGMIGLPSLWHAFDLISGAITSWTF